MAIDGERSLRKMLSLPTAVSSTGSTNVPVNPFPGCCSDFVLNVLADDSGIDSQNDVNTVIWWFDKIATSATLTLKKWINGEWESQGVISNNNYGAYGALGYYQNDSGQKFISLEIKWALVLAALGTGSYKVTCDAVIPILGNTSEDSYEFCLQQYAPELADGTVLLEYWLSGAIGDRTNDTLVKDFGTLSVYNSLRLNGFFGYPKGSYKSEDVEYNNGQRLYVEDEQTPTYKLKLKLIAFFIHEILRTDFMMADTLAITDYNSKNNGAYIQKFVRKDSSYEPSWYELQSNLASVELQFKQAFNRLRKFRQ